MLDPKGCGRGWSIYQQNQIRFLQRVVDLFLNRTAWQDAGFAIKFYCLVEERTMAYAYQVSVKLLSYCCPISLSIRNEYIGITTLQAETKHASNSLRQSAFRTFCSTVIFKSLYRSCRFWRFLGARIEGYWKKNCGVC